MLMFMEATIAQLTPAAPLPRWVIDCRAATRSPEHRTPH